MLSLAIASACGTTGRVTGRWVILAQGQNIAVGQADQPTSEGPLALVPGSPAAGTCLPPEELNRYFGPTCEHEPELGPAPSTPESSFVRWYCHGNIAVRLLLARCPEGQRLRIEQLAVSTAEPR